MAGKRSKSAASGRKLPTATEETRTLKAKFGKRTKPVDILRHTARVFDFAVSGSEVLQSMAGTYMYFWNLVDRTLEIKDDYGVEDVLIAFGHAQTKCPTALAILDTVVVSSESARGADRNLKSASETFNGVAKILISPNDRRLLALSSSGEASMWEIHSGKETHFGPPNVRVVAIGFDGNSPRVAYSHGDNLVVRDLEGGAEIMRVNPGFKVTGGVFFDRTCKLAVSGEVIEGDCGESKVQVWSVLNARRLLEVGGFYHFIWTMAVGDDRYLAIAPSGPAIIVDMQERKQIATMGDDDEWLAPLRFTYDGKMFLAGAADGIRLWNVLDMVQSKTQTK